MKVRRDQRNLKQAIMRLEFVVVITLKTLSSFGFVTINFATRQQIWQTIPIAAAIVSKMSYSSKSLQSVTIPTHNMLKNNIICLMALGESCWF
jgi:hypothetical protein